MAELVEISQIGKRELLFDFISLDDYKEKPLLAMIPKEQRLTNMTMQWQADIYETPLTTGVADGVPVKNVENAGKNRGIISNYAQKWRRTAGVGKIAEQVSVVAGARAGEMARSIDKKMEELSRDIEATLGSDNDAQLEVSESTPYNTRGLGKWFSSTAQTVLPVPAAFLTPAASIDATTAGSLTEGTLQTLLASMFTQYGKSQDLMLVCGTTLKKNITGFTQTQAGSANVMSSLRSFTKALGDREIISNVMVYEGDFNKVQMHTSLLLAQGGSAAVVAGRGYVLALDRVSLHWGWQPEVTPLAEDGSGPRVMIEAVLGLCHKNPLVGGKLAPTS